MRFDKIRRLIEQTEETLAISRQLMAESKRLIAHKSPVESGDIHMHTAAPPRKVSVPVQFPEQPAHDISPNA